MKTFILFLVLLFLFFCSSQLMADSLGFLYLEKGQVKLHRNSVDIIYRKAGRIVTVLNQDEIQTGANTRVKIRFSKQGNEVDLYSLTLFKFDDVTVDKNEVSIVTGKVRLLILKKQFTKTSKQTFRLRTANALIGVKGTEFMVECEDDVTSVLALSGIVTLSNLIELEVAVDLKANHSSQVAQSARPTLPIIVPVKIRQTIISGESKTGFKDLKFGEVVSAIQIEKNSKKPENKESQLDGPVAETKNIRLDEELDAIEDSVDEVMEAAEEQQTELQKIEIAITN